LTDEVVVKAALQQLTGYRHGYSRMREVTIPQLWQPLSAGDVGSQAVAIAKDLLHLADIKVLQGQDLAVAEELDRLLGLGPIAQDLVTGWAMHGEGRAL
jgi:hypothetical protein